MDVLLNLLEGLFQQAAHPSLAKLTQHTNRDPAADARRAIVRAVNALTEWSEKAKRFMVKRKALYLDMVREVAKMFRSGKLVEEDDPTPVTAINSGLALISRLNEEYSAAEQRSMLDEVFQLSATTLKQSVCEPLLLNSVLLLWKMMDQEEVRVRLKSCDGLSGAFMAIAACRAYFYIEVRVFAALLASQTDQVVFPAGTDLDP